VPLRTQQILISCCLAFSLLVVSGMVYLVHSTMADFAGKNSQQTTPAAIAESDQGDFQDYEIIMPEAKPTQRLTPPKLLSEARPDLYIKTVKTTQKFSKAEKIPAFLTTTEVKVTDKDGLAIGKTAASGQKCGECQILSEAAVRN
jgi:hypothetical protein